MESPHIDHHTYNSRKTLWQWLGFLALSTLMVLAIAIMWVGPILAVVGFDWSHPEYQFFIISCFALGYPMGLWGAIEGVKLFRETLSNYRKPGGMSITENAILYDAYNRQTKNYEKGSIPFSNILKCVVAPKTREIPNDDPGSLQVKRYLYYPAVHFVYEAGGTKKTNTLAGEAELIDDLLTRLQKFDVPMWITEYDLTFVPHQKKVETLEEGPLECKPLDFRGRIEEFIPITRTHKTPKRYGKAYLEWTEQQSREQKVKRKSIPYGAIYIGQALLFGLTLYGSTQEWFAPDSIFAWGLPLIGMVGSYVAFLCRLKRIRFWKTVIHIILTFGVLFWVTVFAYAFGAIDIKETFLSCFGSFIVFCLSSPFYYMIVWSYLPIPLPNSMFHDSTHQEPTMKG
ncbi:hypothetical protein JOD24_002028 [Kroppenstedtia sanguinis]|uniref:hypothetical protein n=1 Tax=Kroppenstedtia sanguinis TaxID=1380684 RepID=UPI003D19EBBF